MFDGHSSYHELIVMAQTSRTQWREFMRAHRWMGLAALLMAGPALAQEERPPVRAHAAQLGIGSHYGGFGGAYTFRLNPYFAATAGLGGLAGRVNVGGGLRAYAVGPLYAQLGVSPLAFSGDKAYYGPDITTGVDLVRTRVAFTLGVGVGLLKGRPLPSLDLGVGVNLGNRPDKETP